MEINFSVGTYSVAENGISVTYASPSILPKEMADKFSIDTQDVGSIEQEKITGLGNEIVEAINAINNDIVITLHSTSENKNFEMVDTSQLFDINSEILNADFFAAQPKPKPYEETIKIPFQSNPFI